MKAIPTKCVCNTAWGYCMAPVEFDSKKKAREYGQNMVDNGYAFAFRLFPVKK